MPPEMKETLEKNRPYIVALDDEIDLLTLFKFSMLPEGYEVDIATEEGMFWELIHSKKPSIIFLDIQMPGKEGTELCKELKSNSATAEIPIIFLSAKHDAPQIAAASHADGCIQKPFNSKMVVAEIERIFSKQSRA